MTKTNSFLVGCCCEEKHFSGYAAWSGENLFWGENKFWPHFQAIKPRLQQGNRLKKGCHAAIVSWAAGHRVLLLVVSGGIVSIQGLTIGLTGWMYRKTDKTPRVHYVWVQNWPKEDGLDSWKKNDLRIITKKTMYCFELVIWVSFESINDSVPTKQFEMKYIIFYSHIDYCLSYS